MAARVLSYFAGAHADRKIGVMTPGTASGMRKQRQNCCASGAGRPAKAELREQSRLLVERHWAEIVAVAEELIVAKTLDDTEIETIADMAAVDCTAADDLRLYRAILLQKGK